MINKVLRELNAERRVMARSSERAHKIASLFRQGRTLVSIASEYGITRQRVSQILAAQGMNGADGGRTIVSFLKTEERSAKKKAALAARQRKVYLQTGMDLDSWMDHVKRYGNASVISSPYHKFMRQKMNSRSRGIEWNMTFSQWWSIWSESGKWEQRGVERGCYVMARFGDSGPYEIGNVYICSSSQNCSDGYLTTPAHKRAEKRRKNAEANKI